MSQRRTRKNAKTLPELAQTVAARLRPPVGIALGSPNDAAALIGILPDGEITCYQMDLHQAARLRETLSDRQATVETHADLWDLPQPVQTLLYPVPHGGERALKLDIIEQAFHVLKPHGAFIVLSPYENDDFFHAALKKVFGKVHVPMDADNQVFWCQRDGERPRRRHEMNYHVRVDAETSYSFLSRPGVFGYGFFDEGARALLEAAELSDGQRVLDLGCGVGTVGILAARRVGPAGFVAFADSNLRAIALTEINARNLGLTNYQTFASCTLNELPDASFDVVLANPPYYAQGAIVRLFVERARAVLKPGGTLYLVTKQVDLVYPIVNAYFGEPELFENRGYVIFRTRQPLAA